MLADGRSTGRRTLARLPPTHPGFAPQRASLPRAPGVDCVGEDHDRSVNSARVPLACGACSRQTSALLRGSDPADVRQTDTFTPFHSRPDIESATRLSETRPAFASPQSASGCAEMDAPCGFRASVQRHCGPTSLRYAADRRRCRCSVPRRSARRRSGTHFQVEWPHAHCPGTRDFISNQRPSTVARV